MSPLVSSGNGIPDDKEIQANFNTRPNRDFAYLIPSNNTAIIAFHKLVKYIARRNQLYGHSIKFMRDIKKDSLRAYSPCSENEKDPAEQHELWTGSFAFSLDITPTNKRGWFAGNELRKEYIGRHELLLTPPTEKWLMRGVNGRHLLFSFSPKNGEMELTAFHTTQLAGQPFKHKVRPLQQDDTIAIGDLTYQWRYTPYTDTPQFTTGFNKFIAAADSVQMDSMTAFSTTALSGPSTVRKKKIGKYRCLGDTYDVGPLGQITVGYDQISGNLVAIRYVPYLDMQWMRAHQKIHDRVDLQDYVIRLLDVVMSLDSEQPGRYLIYSPLARGSLDKFVEMYTFDRTAIAMLLRDWAGGVEYVHDKLDSMHRNITPQTLGITEVKDPGGVILDVDLVIRAYWMKDSFGTKHFQPPEIIALEPSRRAKESTGRPYEKPMDIWPLGLCVLAMIEEVGIPEWCSFDTALENEQYKSLGVETCWVTESRWTKFDNHLQNLIVLIGICKGMVVWNPKLRLKASRVFELANGLVRKLPSPGSLTLKSVQT